MDLFEKIPQKTLHKALFLVSFLQGFFGPSFVRCRPVCKACLLTVFWMGRGARGISKKHARTQHVEHGSPKTTTGRRRRWTRIIPTMNHWGPPDSAHAQKVVSAQKHLPGRHKKRVRKQCSETQFEKPVTRARDEKSILEN